MSRTEITSVLSLPLYYGCHFVLSVVQYGTVGVTIQNDKAGYDFLVLRNC